MGGEEAAEPFDTKATAQIAAERMQTIMSRGEGSFSEEEMQSIGLCLRAIETSSAIASLFERHAQDQATPSPIVMPTRQQRRHPR